MFIINKEMVAKDLSIAYFTSLQDKETLEYLGANIIGGYLSFCKLSENEKKEAEKELSYKIYDEDYKVKPKDICSECSDIFNYKCAANAKCIEALLLDNIDFNLGRIFAGYYKKEFGLKEAQKAINDMLDMNNAKLKTQIVLRDSSLDLDSNKYLSYFTSIHLNKE